MVENSFREFRFFMPSLADIENLRIQAYSMLALADKLELEEKGKAKIEDNNIYNLKPSYTKKELAKFLNCHLCNIDKLHTRGLKFSKNVRFVFYKRQDVEDFLKANPRYPLPKNNLKK